MAEATTHASVVSTAPPHAAPAAGPAAAVDTASARLGAAVGPAAEAPAQVGKTTAPDAAHAESAVAAGALQTTEDAAVLPAGNGIGTCRCGGQEMVA